MYNFMFVFNKLLPGTHSLEQHAQNKVIHMWEEALTSVAQLYPECPFPNPCSLGAPNRWA